MAMKIANRDIGSRHPPFIVAEISGNHCGQLELAKRLIKSAKRVGADAVKTQCYDPDSLTLDIKKPDFIVQNGLWKGRTLYELYSKAYTPPAWHGELYKAAHHEDIPIFSSVFDQRGVDLLEKLGCPAYKIASFEITDIPLIRYAASTGKPIIISTGLADDDEILDANEAAGKKAAFLHCTSDYPAEIENANLSRMWDLQTLLNSRLIGISDHTLGCEVPIAATAMGAVIIEKHLKLESADGYAHSEDEQFSMNPVRFMEMVDQVRKIYEGMMAKPVNTGSRQFRRSLYAVADIKKGEVYSEKNVRSIRPGYGLPPKMLPRILGKKSMRDWRKGDPLS